MIRLIHGFNEVVIFKLDILVNNAGRTQRAVWENIDLEVDKEVFELNLFSIISLSRVVLKYFLRKGEGHFAVTSSVGGIANHPYSSSYSGSKHALHVSKIKFKKFFLNSFNSFKDHVTKFL